MSVLVAYFSVGGNTRKVAEATTKALSADLFEIKPVKPYTAADINWVNPFARCNREKLRRKDVPIRGEVKNFDSYDTVFIGFPIWFGTAPGIVNTFCKAYNWKDKKVYIFSTSGGSGMGKTTEKLAPYLIGADIVGEMLVSSYDVLEKWISSQILK
jgi:flavodoxin